MQQIIQKYWQKYRELVMYGFFGVLTTLVNWGLYWLMADVLHVHYMAATFFAQVLAILFAYFTNRRWVFESRASGARAVALEMARFFPGDGHAVYVRGGGFAPCGRQNREGGLQRGGGDCQLCFQQAVRVPQAVRVQRNLT